MLMDWLLDFFMPKVFLQFGGGKKQSMDTYNPPAYNGPMPWTPDQVGWSAEKLKPLAEQYKDQLFQMARGEGQVGFAPEWYNTRKRMGLSDLGEQYKEGRQIRSAQSSGQGLRGGTPISIERQAQEDYGDQTQRFLDQLSIADLEARREDTNKAIYSQPQLVGQASDMQAGAANFGLQKYQAEQPVLLGYGDEGNSWLGPALGLAGTLGGAFLGGPGGAALGGAIGSSLGGSVNKSTGTTNKNALYDAVKQAAYLNKFGQS